MTSWRVLRLLAVILLVVCWFLAAWTSAVCERPDRKAALIDVGYTPEGLQFSTCLLDRWDYMTAVGKDRRGARRANPHAVLHLLTQPPAGRTDGPSHSGGLPLEKTGELAPSSFSLPAACLQLPWRRHRQLPWSRSQFLREQGLAVSA